MKTSASMGSPCWASIEVVKNVTPFLTAGAFPVFNTDFNFSTNQPVEIQEHGQMAVRRAGGTST